MVAHVTDGAPRDVTRLTSIQVRPLRSGQYTLVAWQEHTGEVEQPITVKAKEATTLTIDLKK